MQANTDFGDDRDDGNHGVDDDRNDSAPAQFIGIRAPEMASRQFPPQRVRNIDLAIKIAQFRSRDTGYAEMFDLATGDIIAIFIWGHQVAVNRFWRETAAKSESNARKRAPKAQKGSKK